MKIVPPTSEDTARVDVKLTIPIQAPTAQEVSIGFSRRPMSGAAIV